MDIEKAKELLEEYRDDKLFGVAGREALGVVLSELEKKEKIIDKALEIAFQYGQIDGEHHKLWVIDQIVENLTGDKYKEFIEKYRYDEETGDYYSWDKGIAP